MLIPDRFSVGGAVFGVLFCFTFPELNEMAFDQTWLSHFASGFNSLLGLLIGSSLLYWIGTLAHIGFGREALGEGDVKLLGCIGAFCGWKGAIFAIFGGAFLGTLLLLPLMIFQKSVSASTENENSDKNLQWGAEVPFGPYLAIGGIVYLGGASEVIDSWFDPILWFFDNTSLLKAF
jgi:leader peptidase (prepilin peptidase)/N-methyltransferase